MTPNKSILEFNDYAHFTGIAGTTYFRVVILLIIITHYNRPAHLWLPIPQSRGQGEKNREIEEKTPRNYLYYLCICRKRRPPPTALVYSSSSRRAHVILQPHHVSAAVCFATRWGPWRVSMPPCMLRTEREFRNVGVTKQGLDLHATTAVKPIWTIIHRMRQSSMVSWRRARATSPVSPTTCERQTRKLERLRVAHAVYRFVHTYTYQV